MSKEQWGGCKNCYYGYLEDEDNNLCYTCELVRKFQEEEDIDDPEELLVEVFDWLEELTALRREKARERGLLDEL